MLLPTSISASNVLDGIADAVAIIRAPQADAETIEETIEFDTGPHVPPLIFFQPLNPIIQTAKSGKLYHEFDQVRARIEFNLPFVTSAEAIKWRKLWNYHMARYYIYMRPHNDNSLSLEWQVVPTPNTEHVLQYLFQKYLGHAAQFSFTAVYPQSAMNLKTSAARFRPAHT